MTLSCKIPSLSSDAPISINSLGNLTHIDFLNKNTACNNVDIIDLLAFMVTNFFVITKFVIYFSPDCTQGW